MFIVIGLLIRICSNELFALVQFGSFCAKIAGELFLFLLVTLKVVNITYKWLSIIALEHGPRRFKFCDFDGLMKSDNGICSKCLEVAVIIKLVWWKKFKMSIVDKILVIMHIASVSVRNFFEWICYYYERIKQIDWLQKATYMVCLFYNLIKSILFFWYFISYPHLYCNTLYIRKLSGCLHSS